jgi:large subunit ribosomal protein L10
MPTKEKEKQIELLTERFKRASSVIVADHTGINVADITVLRRDLRKANAEFKIAKNTLFRKAAKDAGMEQMAEHFVGPTTLVYGFDDPSVPAKIIFEFSKKSDIPKVKAYYLDNVSLPIDDYKRIAQLPPREQVLALVVGAVNGPILNFIMTIDGATRNFIGLLDALAESKK